MQLNLFLEACLYCSMHAQSEEELSIVIRLTAQPQIYYQHLKYHLWKKKSNPKVSEEFFHLHMPAK